MTSAFDDWKRIRDFQAFGGRDTENRTLRDYRAFTDAQMESAHDYIQWMFPTDQRSKFNPAAPLLVEADFFGNRDMVAPVFRSAFQFLGFLARTKHWRRNDDHNMLRITRMLRSVTLICGVSAALDLLDVLMEYTMPFGRETIPVCLLAADKGECPVLDYWIAAIIGADTETANRIYVAGDCTVREGIIKYLETKP